MHFTLNGQAVCADGYAPQTTLLDFLRLRGLTGAKEGCAEGECGACAVALLRSSSGGSEYRAVNSCLLFLPMAAGQEVVTVEALAAGGRLSEVQRALAEGGGSQCGYCTPGFVMSLFAEYYRPSRSGPCDPHAMSGNLCRCTGYRPIRDAALSLGAAPADGFRARLARPAPPVEAFDYEYRNARFLRPANLGDCLALLATHPDARLIAGGTDMVVESNLGDRRWPALIAVDALSELRTFRDDSVSVEIGAALTLSEIEALWTDAPPAAREWFPLFASPLIRNRATLGGNLATASPIGDAAPLLLALDASVKIAGVRGHRLVSLDSFFPGYRRTVLEPGELIVSVTVPKPYPARARFFKVAKRRMDDISTVAATFAIDLDAAGRVARARLAYGGVAAVPLRVPSAEQALLGRPWNEAALTDVRAAVARSLQPLSDHRGSASYRLAMAQSLLEKFYFEERPGAAA